MLQRTNLVAAEPVRFPAGRPDRTYKVTLVEGRPATFNGKVHGQNEPLDVRQGERIRLDFTNSTNHVPPQAPARSHVPRHRRQRGPAPGRNPTIVRPDEPVSVEFIADNPGQWMIHCHDNYHQMGGMMMTLSYVTDRKSKPGSGPRASAWCATGSRPRRADSRRRAASRHFSPPALEAMCYSDSHGAVPA